MAGFQQDIGQIEVQAAEHRVVVDNSASAQAAAVGSLVKGGAALNDVRLKNEFASEISGIEKDASIFANLQKSAKTDLLDALSEGVISGSEAAKVDTLNAKLRNIEKGEAGQKLSPGAAGAMRNAALKQAITDSPWLASDFRSIATRSGPSGGSRATPSATDKALEKAQAEAVLHGIPLSQVIKQNNKARQLEIEAQEFTAKKQQGLAAFADVNIQVNADARIMSTGLRAELFKMLEGDPKNLNAPDWEERVNQLESQLTANMLSRTSGLILSKPERDTLNATIKTEMSFARGFVKSHDRVAYVERQQKLMKAQSDEWLFDSNPALFNCQLHQGSDYCAKLQYDVWPTYLAKLGKHGGINAIRDIANRGNDLKAMQFMQMWDFNKNAMTPVLMEKVRRGEKADSVYEQFLMDGMSGSILATESIGDKSTEDKLKAAATSSLADRELAHFNRPDVINSSSDSKKVRSELDNSMNFKTDAAMSRIATALLERKGAELVWDDLSSAFVIEGKDGKILHVAGGPESQGAGAEIGSMVNYLNTAAQVRRNWIMYPEGGRQSWVNSVVVSTKERNRAASKAPVDEEGGQVARGTVNRDETAEGVQGKGEPTPEPLITIEADDGGWINLPTVIDGKQVSESDAISAYRQGKLKPKGKTYKSLEEAESAAGR